MSLPKAFIYNGGLRHWGRSSLQQKKERERLRRLRRLTTDDTSASGVGRPLGTADRQTDETTRYQHTNDKRPLHRTTGSKYRISCMVPHWNVLTIIKDSEESYSKNETEAYSIYRVIHEALPPLLQHILLVKIMKKCYINIGPKTLR
ncbi:hypothetical protein J6590_065622 [Homalodisca vitripennis]|nr:hypothetical protein J6590_065622 [Homalodisca vitripennis]